MAVKPFFPALVLFHLSKPLDLTDLEERLAECRYQPCGAQDRSRLGFAPALGDKAKALVYQSQQHILLRLVREERKIPPSALNRQHGEIVREKEAEQGRPLNKKEKEQLKEELILQLLPRAFSQLSETRIWIDLAAQTIAVSTNSDNRAMDALAILRKAIGSAPAVPLAPRQRPEAQMAGWVTGTGRPELGFMVGDGIALRSDDSSQLRAHNCGDLDHYEPVTAALASGQHEAESIRLVWRQILAFTLTADLRIRQVKMGDEFGEQADREEDPLDAAAANMVLACGVMRDFIADLRALLDDESRPTLERFEITADQVRELLLRSAERRDSNHFTQADAMLALGVGPHGLQAALQAQAEQEGSSLDFASPPSGEDALLAEARAWVRSSGSASVSGLQRKFKIGYNRACRLMDALEADGTVTPRNAEGLREVAA